MVVTIDPEAGRISRPLTFPAVVPPDKSVLHRFLLISALTQSHCTIRIGSIESISHDVIATVLALESLGVPIELFPERIEVQGVGLRGLRAPTHRINCANSGTTARLLMGLLVGQPFDSSLIGDASLSKRPMRRLAEILNKDFGAHIMTSVDGTLPIAIEGTILKPSDVVLPIASAQMKSAALLAGLFADGVTSVRSPNPSRDHTERLLTAFGCNLWKEVDTIFLEGPGQFSIPEEIVYTPPGDLSSAAFLIAAAVMVRKRIRIEHVLLNSTRTRYFDILREMGIEIETSDVVSDLGEDCGTIIVRGDLVGDLKPFTIRGADVPLLIDELPVLVVLAAFASGESSVRDAAELRHKESDRIRMMSLQLSAFGIECHEFDDGMIVQGDPVRILEGGVIEHAGDHRIAMAFAVGALRSNEPVICPEAEAVSISFPGFFAELCKIAGRGSVVSSIPDGH